MPRYYRRRYTRVVRPKKKWASNIAVWNDEEIAGTSSVLLVSNNIQSGTPTPSIIKVGNFKISIDIVLSLNVGTLTNYNPIVVGYVLYVPEGWEIGITAFDNLIEKHPEWILGTKTVGSSLVASSANLFSVDSLNMSTRLKRNLNSGDRIYFYLRANSMSKCKITGTCRYWTCTN